MAPNTEECQDAPAQESAGTGMEDATNGVGSADASGSSEAEDFVVSLARALHRSGMASHHLESLLGRVAARLELDAQMLSLPTAFLASFSGHRPAPSVRTVIVRLDPGSIDLTRQSKLILVGRRVADGTMTVDEARARMSAVEREPGPSWWLLLCAGTVVAGAASRWFGGGFGEVIIGSVIGFFAVIIARLVRGTRAQRLYEPLAAISAAVVASLGTRWLVAASPTVAVLGGFLLLLPGYAFTVGMDELSARHWVAGTARLAGAFSVILFLGLSVLVASKLAELLPGGPSLTALPPLPPWFDVAAVVVGLVSLAVWFRTPWIDLPWVVVLGGLAELIERTAAPPLGSPLAASVAALFLAVTCNGVARLAGRVANAVLAPSLMLLVPGSLGLRSLFALSERNVLSGVEAAYQMSAVAVAIVTGLLLGNLLLPSRSQ
jgi:uncharacterized membrane protein YjjP (DUF1212 family)